MCKLIKNNNNDDDLLGSKHISNFKKPFKIKRLVGNGRTIFSFCSFLKKNLKNK